MKINERENISSILCSDLIAGSYIGLEGDRVMNCIWGKAEENSENYASLDFMEPQWSLTDVFWKPGVTKPKTNK